MIAGIVKILTGGLLDRVLEAYKLHQQGKLSEAEFRARVEIAGREATAQIEKEWAQAASDIASATHASLTASPILQRAWAATLFLQVAVLVFYQIGAPAYAVITGTAWPSPGISLEWAYLLVAAMIGAGPLVMRR